MNDIPPTPEKPSEPDHKTNVGSGASDCSAFGETPATDKLLQEQFIQQGHLGPENCPEWLVAHARALEKENIHLRGRFTNLDRPKRQGEPMLDSILITMNPHFRAWVESLPTTYWARYDLSAARIGWEAGVSFCRHNATEQASPPVKPNDERKLEP